MDLVNKNEKSGNSIFQLLGNLSIDLRKKFNKLIEEEKKLIKIKEDITFFTKCKSSHIVPSFITNTTKHLNTLKTHNTKHNNKIDKIIDKTSLTLLNTIIGEKHRTQKHQNITISCLTNKIYSLLNNNLITECKKYINKVKTSYTTHIKNIQKNKYNKLKQKYDLNYKTNEQWIKNLTNTEIPNNVAYTLSLGPKFCFTNKINKKDIFNLIKDTEHIIDSLPDNSDNKNDIRGKFTNIITNTIHKNNKLNTHPHDNFLNESLKQTKKFLRNNPHLIILPADKGNTTVIMNKEEYNRKVEELLNDPNTYSIIPNYKTKNIQRDPTTQKQNEHNSLIKQLHEEGIIDKKTKTNLTTYTSIPPKFYALPKIHKNPVTLRPIVSCINSPSYNLSKFLSNMLTPYRNTYNYNINNAYQVIQQIKDIPLLEENDTLISLDVQSLFTSIPLTLAKHITKALWSKIYTHTQISKQLYYNIVDFCLEHTYFTHNNILYIQKEGLPMGDPLSPIIADLVLDKVFHDIVPQYTKHIKYCKKYVDDSILIINKEYINILHNHFNTYHKNLKFTIEHELNNKIPFLNIEIHKLPNGKLTYQHYTKLTYSGRLLNFYSHQPYSYKHNCARNFIHQTFNLTHPQFHNNKLTFIKKTLSDNNYPSHMINKLIEEYTPTNNKNTQINYPSNTNPIPSNTTPCPNQYHTLTYIKNSTNNIIKLFKQYPNIKISSTNQSTFKSNIFTKLKDPTPTYKRSNIIYQIPCKDCNKTYTGVSSQTFKSRITQHISDVKNKPYSTALSEHLHNTNHSIDTDNCKVLHTEKHHKKRLTLEMIYIKLDQHSMNKKQDTSQLNNIYSNILTLTNKL